MIDLYFLSMIYELLIISILPIYERYKNIMKKNRLSFLQWFEHVEVLMFVQRSYLFSRSLHVNRFRNSISNWTENINCFLTNITVFHCLRCTNTIFRVNYKHFLKQVSLVEWNRVLHILSKANDALPILVQDILVLNCIEKSSLKNHLVENWSETEHIADCIKDRFLIISDS